MTVSLQAPLSLGISKQEYQSEFPFPSPGDLPNPGIEPWFPALQADYLPAEPAEKPKNTGMGSLSLLQRIFSTQESNWGLLQCRQILYQLAIREALIQEDPIYSLFVRKLSFFFLNAFIDYFWLHLVFLGGHGFL